MCTGGPGPPAMRSPRAPRSTSWSTCSPRPAGVMRPRTSSPPPPRSSSRSTRRSDLMAVRPEPLARSAPVAARRQLSVRSVLEREGAFSWLMLTPGVLFLLAFVAYPFFYGIWLSLQDRPVAKPGVFVGLANFITLANDGVFWQVSRNTFVYTAGTTALKLLGGLAMALVIN